VGARDEIVVELETLPVRRGTREPIDLLAAWPVGFLLAEFGLVIDEAVLLNLHQLVNNAQGRDVARGGKFGADTEKVDGRALRDQLCTVPVAFNVRIFKTVRYVSPDAPALLVLGNYLRDTFLHRELREKGGAYGGFAQAAVGSGTFYFGSYRDPNIVKTYEVYDRAVKWMTDTEIDPEALKESILGACGDVDPLESPDIKGRREATNRLTGFTREERERFKQRLLRVTADDLRRVTGAYLTVPRPVQATVAGPELVEAARKELPHLFEVVAPI